MTRKFISARAGYIARLHRAGDARKIIGHAAELPPGAKVVYCMRVSGHTQDHNGNLDDQEGWGRHVLGILGVKVVRVLAAVRSGSDPIWLAEAADFARRHGAVLVAETTDRFIRHPHYHSAKWPDLQARDAELWDLRLYTGGVPLYTLLAPDATPSEVRSYQRKRGQWAKRRKGGRPRRSDLEAVWDRLKSLPR